MVRRTLLVGLVLVLSHLASGCCPKCKQVRERPFHAKHHSAAVMGEPCGCSCSGIGPSPIFTSAPLGEPPLIRQEGAPLPAPQKLPGNNAVPIVTTSQPKPLTFSGR